MLPDVGRWKAYKKLRCVKGLLHAIEGEGSKGERSKGEMSKGEGSKGERSKGVGRKAIEQRRCVVAR